MRIPGQKKCRERGENHWDSSFGKRNKKTGKLELCDIVLKLDASYALSCHESIYKNTNGKLADVVINCVNISSTELPSILIYKDKGCVYFFSMATSFTKAALGAEGMGKDIDMIVGNSYAKDHADIALDIIKESEKLRTFFEKQYQ